MRIILINRDHAGSRTIHLGRWSRALVSLCCLGLPLGMVAMGYHLAQLSEVPTVRDLSLAAMQDELRSQDKELNRLRDKAQRSLQVFTMTVAGLQARLLRLDAMGEQITTMAGLDNGEFDFSQTPALGGPITSDLGPAFSEPELAAEIDAFAARIADRQRQLGVLESLLSNRKLEDDIYLSGRPILKGWMSSPFGRRTDPFTGNAAWHEGLDFAGTEGSDVIAVAAGVVTWSGDRYGYGAMIEVNHGGGYSTRYGHNQENLVKVGDIVKKGQTVALMGSSGRSTGPHVHYEVYKHGRPVDPASYVQRTQR